MSRQSVQNPSIYTRIILIVGVVIIAIIPVFLTFAPKEWPPQLPILVIDVAYLLIAACCLLVLVGKYRPQWLMATMISISTISIIVMGWLMLTLTTLKVDW